MSSSVAVRRDVTAIEERVGAMGRRSCTTSPPRRSVRAQRRTENGLRRQHTRFDWQLRNALHIHTVGR